MCTAIVYISRLNAMFQQKRKEKVFPQTRAPLPDEPDAADASWMEDGAAGYAVA